MFSKSLIFLKTGWRTCPQNVSGMAPRFRSTLNSLLFMSEVCGHKFYRPIPPPPIFINGTHALPFPVLARSIHKRAVNVCCSSGRITFYTSLNKDPSLRFFFFFLSAFPVESAIFKSIFPTWRFLMWEHWVICVYFVGA